MKTIVPNEVIGQILRWDAFEGDQKWLQRTMELIDILNVIESMFSSASKQLHTTQVTFFPETIIDIGAVRAQGR